MDTGTQLAFSADRFQVLPPQRAAHVGECIAIVTLYCIRVSKFFFMQHDRGVGKQAGVCNAVSWRRQNREASSSSRKICCYYAYVKNE